MENNEVQKSIYDSEKYVKRAGLLNEFLWICAGADRKILRQCPTDYAKYAGIGGTILFTALMAGLSGGYALFSVFKSRLTADLFGVFWGLLIFNLDRFIVNTMYSDGKVTISWREFTSGLPRIIMAVFLGIVISTPLELKIFEDEISLTISDMKKDRVKEYTMQDDLHIETLESKKNQLRSQIDSIQNAPVSLYAGSISTGSVTVNNLLRQMDEKEAIYKEAQRKIAELARRRSALSPADSLEYQRLTNQIWSQRKLSNAVSREMNTLNGEIGAQDANLKTLISQNENLKRTAINGIQNDINNIDAEIGRLKADRDNAEKKYKDQLDKEYGGFQAKMLAFSQMKKSTPSTRIVALFIMLLFVIIETAPTFFKMMIASGPYDDLLRAEMHRVRVLSDKRISDVNDEVNTAVTISVEKNKDRLAAELAANKAVLKKIADAQAELLDTAIEEWRKEELEKVKSNPSAYVSSSSDTKVD